MEFTPLLRNLLPAYFGIFKLDKFEGVAVPSKVIKVTGKKSKTNSPMAYGISTGIIFKSNQYTCRAFSHPYFLPQIGEVLSEIAPDPLLKPVLLPSIVDESIIPRDKTRASAAAEVALKMIKFAVRHEYTHLMHGHSSYLRSHKGTQPFTGPDGNIIEITPSMISQAMEFQCDLQAAASVLYESLYSFYSLRKSNERSPYRPVRTEHDAIFSSFLAVYLVFCIISWEEQRDVTLVSSRWEDYNHAPANLRLMYSLATVENLLVEQLGFTISESIRLNIIEAGKLFCSINGLALRFPHESEKPKTQNYIVNLRNLSNCLQKELSEHSFVDLNAPVEYVARLHDLKNSPSRKN